MRWAHHIFGSISGLFALLSLVVACGLTSPGHAEEALTVTDVRIGQHGNTTRFVLDLTGTVEYQVFALADPDRIVVDLPQFQWSASEKEGETKHGLISGYRYRSCSGRTRCASPAVRQRNRRNLRKAALDAWSEYATACGLIAEPCLTRYEAEQRCRAAGDCFNSDGRAWSPQHAAAWVFGLASRLHRRLLPELRALSGPVVFELRMPPRYRLRTFVILPDPGSLDAAQTLPANVFLGTPQTLDLFLHYVDAFLYWQLPRELRDLGIRPPSAAEFLQSCRFYSQGMYLRYPGFVSQVTFTPVTATAAVRHALDWLSRGEIPPPLPEG